MAAPSSVVERAAAMLVRYELFKSRGDFDSFFEDEARQQADQLQATGDVALMYALASGTLLRKQPLRAFVSALYQREGALNGLTRGDYQIIAVLSWIVLFGLSGADRDTVKGIDGALHLFAQVEPRLSKAVLTFAFGLDSAQRSSLLETWGKLLDRRWVEATVFTSLDAHKDVATGWLRVRERASQLAGLATATGIDSARLSSDGGDCSVTMPVSPKLATAARAIGRGRGPLPAVIYRIPRGFSALPAPEWLDDPSLSQSGGS